MAQAEALGRDWPLSAAWLLAPTLSPGVHRNDKATNLVDPPVRRTQGGRTTETYRRGRGFDVGLSWSW